jgi:hypothetical protein
MWTYTRMDPTNNATTSQSMSNTSSAQQYPPQPPIWPTGFMQQPPMDYNMMAYLNFPNPGQGPTTMWAPMQTGNSTSQSTMIPASQSAVYWNHYMNFVRNPLGSVEANPFGDSYPTSNTSTPLQGSNTIPSIPVNLDSDAEHSVQDINSPEKNAAPVLKNKKSKEQNFTAPEDLLLCTTWLQISSDPIVHTRQRREGLWARIEKRYNEQRGQYPCRLNRALSSRWVKIRADVSKFSGYYARVLRENQSGLTDDDKVRQIIQSLTHVHYLLVCTSYYIYLIHLIFLQTSKAATLFAHEENKPFHYMHCWHQLKGEPKWESICQGHSFRGLNAKPIGSPGTPFVEAHETDSGSAGLTGKRPRGHDYSKSERKKGASSSSTEYLSRLQEMTEKQIQRSIEKCEKKDKSSEEDGEIEKKRLELEAEKVIIRQRELKLQELESAQSRLQMLCSTNEADVDLEVWIMMKEQKKKLQQFIFRFE